MNDWQTIYNLIKVILTWGYCWDCFPGKYLVGRLWCNPIFRHCRRKPIKRDLLPRQPPTGSQEIILLQLSIFLEIAQELYQVDQLFFYVLFGNCWEYVYFWGFLTFPPPSSDLEHAQTGHIHSNNHFLNDNSGMYVIELVLLYRYAQ